MGADIAQKFNFDTVFDAGGNILETGDSWRQNIPRKEAEQQATEAFERGRQETTVTAERETASSIEELSRQLREILSETRQMSHQYRTDAAHLAQIISAKIAGVALQKFEQEHVSSLISRTLNELKGAPRVVITTSASIAKKIQEQMPDLLEHAEFSGSIRFEESTDATPGSVALEWGEGSVKFDPKEIGARINTEVENWLVTIEQQDAEQSQNTKIKEGTSDV